MADLGKTPKVMGFEKGSYVIDASRAYFDGPFDADEASTKLKAYEAEIAVKKAEKEEKWKKMTEKGADIVTDEEVSDIAQYLDSID